MRRDITVTETGCWLYPQEHGAAYGLVMVGGRYLSAHRVSYELFVGPIPPGHTLEWSCKNRACMNWNHLVPVTHPPEPVDRHGLPCNRERSHCRRGHAFAPENTYYYRDRRYCRACARERQRKLRPLEACQ